MAVNVKGVLVVHEAPDSRRCWGPGRRRDLVITASVAGLGAAPKMSIYAVSARRVIGLTKSAAIEYAKERASARQRRRVSAVIEHRHVRPRLEADPRMGSSPPAMHPLGRVGRVEEIAAAVLYLCSDNAGFHHRYRLAGGRRGDGDLSGRDAIRDARRGACVSLLQVGAVWRRQALRGINLGRRIGARARLHRIGA
ncbi:SDR family oxidoreductase [Pseudomonas aeruginosa]